MTIMRIHFRYLLLLICYVIPAIAHGQTLPSDSIVHKFDLFRKHALQEKLYVHIDRSFYVTGEIAWFKVYVTDASFHKPLNISKVAYVELMDASNRPVLQAKIGLLNGSGNGSFFLPATLSSGNYQLRAYTNWMKNFNPDLYFNQTITLINPFTGGSPDISSLPAVSYTVQFFPEGGHLVHNVRSKVAFRIESSAGTGANLPGAVLNDAGDTVVTFRPRRFGIGYFYFTPKVGQHYRAVLKTGVRAVIPVTFPDIEANGYAIHLSDGGSETLTLRVSRHGDAARSASVYVFVHARQIIVRGEALRFQNDSVEFKIAKTDLPEGISHFTVFTDKQQPVCERLYFRRPQPRTVLSAASDQAEYGVRRKVTVALRASRNGTSIPIPDVSVAVYRVDSLVLYPQHNIFSYLWLSSELTGTVDSAAYYFQDPTHDVVAATDNLMLTHGWRRFRWDEVLSHNYRTPYVAEYRGHIVRGRITSPGDTSNAGVLAYLSWPGKIVRLHSARSNNKGEVQFEVKDFTGLRRLVAQTDLRQDSLHRVTIDDPFSDVFATRKLSYFGLLPANLEPSLQKRAIAMQVNSIYHEGALQSFRKSTGDSIAFYGKPDETYILDAYTRFPVMEEVMREYVPGVLVRKRRDGFHFLLLDDVHHSAFTGDPMILMDGVPVFDTDRIMAFDPLKVRKLEAVTRKYYLGPAIFQGIVSYSTYNGDLGGFELDPKSFVLDYEGLQQQREFYSPVYDNPKQRNSRLADQRYLLYWTPVVTPQADGSGKLAFYTSDIPGRYRIVVEGLTAAGEATHAEQTFTVKRFDD